MKWKWNKVNFELQTFTVSLFDTKPMSSGTERKRFTRERSVTVDAQSVGRTIVRLFRTLVNIWELKSYSELRSAVQVPNKNGMCCVRVGYRPAHLPLETSRRNPEWQAARGLHRYDPIVLTQSSSARRHRWLPSSHSFISTWIATPSQHLSLQTVLQSEYYRDGPRKNIG